MSNPNKELKYLWIEDQYDDFTPGLDVLKRELEKNSIIFIENDSKRAVNLGAAELLFAHCVDDNYQPDIILLDLMLPQDSKDQEEDNDKGKVKVNLDGGYFIWYKIRKMKKWPIISDVPIIIITARGRTVYREQIIQDPKTKWLSKPADPSQLAMEICDLLNT